MYKNGLLNSDINRVAGDLGHTDRICICDCGLPIPSNVKKIDLAVRFDLPRFFDVLSEVSSHLIVEKVIVAQEMLQGNRELYEQIEALFPKVKIEEVPHSEFKELTKSCKAVIRTGETHAFANIILQSGCIF